MPPIVFGAPMIPDPALLAALTAEALGSGWLSNGGALHMRLEQALSGQERAGDAVSLTSSGTMALLLALGLGDLPPGAEVITSPLSFAATAQAIAWCGLRPVFADVEPDTLTLCPRAVRAAITPRTAAILPVHFLGVPCDVKALAALAREYGLWLVYDAAQAYGVSFNGRPIGNYGDASAFSLHPTKVLHTGEGGYVVTRRKQAAALRRMRNFGLEGGRAVGRGLNGKMSEVNAAMGLALLPDLAAELAARAALRATYDAGLGGIAGLRLHATRSGASASPGYYALRLAPDLRARVFHALAAAGILARDHFPLLCGAGTFWADAPIMTAEGGAPLAPELGPEVLCLPLHGRVTQDAAAAIVRIVRQSVGQAGGMA
ncbi:DegT/DnrJ/EryC1/StrS family aminotransferase [Gemmobacter serpentinus]|uniref:DegT/DnrJ/EryC1/StrS family aminotransferase n=1 Tax=Gemmobacter serpentinus TaxID=2652247 RepID=UPI00124CEC32|nr:DegT/DnrJ/EryC1/StrS family aminotransferase [Gemmobacter serpentinus]